MIESKYMDYTELEIAEILRIIKDISTEETEELKFNLEEKLKQKLV